ncbi:MAG: C10 family peptidase, partial [Victivallales bacterium]|nr:C10 family peptidase [Victivallales bacterium]
MTKKNNATVQRLTAACLAVVFAMLLGTTASAASIDRDTALAFATNWLAATDNPLGADISSRTFADVEPFNAPDGATLAWVLPMNPKGFLVLAADDRMNPVVMVSAEGSFDADKRNPTVALLTADLTNRLKAANEMASDEQTRGAEIPAIVTANRNTWQQFKEQTRSTGNMVISDIWVDVLLKTRWAQTDGIYNYYTPHIYESSYSFDTPGNVDNICTGCVATGTAQILRYFQWPQKDVGDVTGSCTIIYLDQNDPSKYNVSKGMDQAYGIALSDVRFRGGDGNGGAYRWDLMTEVPSADDSVKSFQQIGALCLDAGLSVGMLYDGTVPEAGANYNPATIQSSFQYQYARGGSTYSSTRANLDARRPVAVSISSINPQGSGHAIVCDGYGKMDGRWYYHMNMGWGGSQDYWYNFDENFTEWSKDISFSVENIYRQPLQKNEISGGVVVQGAILSGRVTDSQGNPVSGVKVKLQKNGEDFLNMLAWYDPIDPVETPVYRDWDQAGNNNGVWEEDELPGADKYRNSTDAKGIWAIDKVANGTYTLVFEKDGLNFMGVKEVTVSGAQNQWGLNIVATPQEELAVSNAWKTGNTLYIKFNHAVGNVQVNPSLITVGGSALSANLTWHVSPSSDTISIEGVTGSGALVLKDGALFIDVDGEYTTDQDGMNDVPVVKVVISGSTTIGSAAPATSKVTGIALKNTQNTKANELVYKVTGTLGDIKVGDFKLRVQSTGKAATFLPRASIVKWDAASGELTVRAQDGEANIFVDYVPEDTEADASFISTAYYIFDDCGPAIIKADLDYTNRFVTIEWNEMVEGWTKPIAVTDLNVILHNNGGSITSAQIESVTTTSGSAITGPVNKIRVYLKYNPSLEVALNKGAVTNAANLPNEDENSDVIAAYKVPAGVESVEVVARENKVFDALKNAASAANTTQPMLLFASNRPRLVSAVMGYDNYSVQ